MKLDEIKDELKQLDMDALKAKIDTWRQELFSLRINASTSHVKDYSQFKKLRKNIARALTYVRQQEQLTGNNNA